MQDGMYFFIIWFFFMISIIAILVIKGEKSLSKFPETNKDKFEFQEKYASGYSTQSTNLQSGGAKNVLRISVLKDEVWISTNLLMGYIAERIDMLHRIPVGSIKSVTVEGGKINLKFSVLGKAKSIVLISSNKEKLLALLKDKIEA